MKKLEAVSKMAENLEKEVERLRKSNTEWKIFTGGAALMTLILGRGLHNNSTKLDSLRKEHQECQEELRTYQAASRFEINEDANGDGIKDIIYTRQESILYGIETPTGTSYLTQEQFQEYQTSQEIIRRAQEGGEK